MPPEYRLRSAFFALLVASAAAAAHAGDIYRWVDDEGRTHLSDKVPDQYRSRAKKYESDSFKASDADQKASRERTDRIRKEADAMERARTAPPPRPAVVVGTEAPPGASAGADAGNSSQSSACQAAWAGYFASQQCFNRFRTKTGLRADAFDACGAPVADPSSSCGSPPNLPDAPAPAAAPGQ